MGVYYKDPYVVGQHKDHPSSDGATLGSTQHPQAREM